MEIEKIVNEEGKCVYNITGRVDTQTAPELQKEVDESFKNGETNLIFNFENVEYLSSAGLRTVLYTQKKANVTENSSFEVINVKPEVMEVFDMTGFNDMVKITPAEK